MARRRRWGALALVLVLAAAARADPRLGDAAPPLAGESWSGVVVVDFFATWCGPCQEAMKVLDELSRRLEVRLVIVDVGESEESVGRFFAAHPLPPRARLVLDPRGEAARTWGQRRFPTTFLVGGGVIRHINRGFGSGYAARLAGWLRDML